MKNLNISPDTTEESCIFFVWPLDIVHVIDEESPFYEISEADLAKERFELLVVMEGTNETSNMTFQARLAKLRVHDLLERYLLQDFLPAAGDYVGPQV